MSERKYSVSEMDRMRRTLSWLHRPGGPYRQHEEDARMENILRTYMQNGTDPEELETAMNEMIARQGEARRQREAEQEKKPADPERPVYDSRTWTGSY